MLHSFNNHRTRSHPRVNMTSGFSPPDLLVDRPCYLDPRSLLNQLIVEIDLTSPLTVTTK